MRSCSLACSSTVIRGELALRDSHLRFCLSLRLFQLLCSGCRATCCCAFKLPHSIVVELLLVDVAGVGLPTGVDTATTGVVTPGAELGALWAQEETARQAATQLTSAASFGGCVRRVEAAIKCTVFKSGLLPRFSFQKLGKTNVQVGCGRQVVG